MTIHNSLAELIGNTPLVKLNHIPQAAGVKATIAVKVEYFNPGGSSKDRIAERIIDAAEQSGQLKPGGVIVNTSRGALVDTEALIEGLRSRKIGAACLDVYEEEAELFYEDRSEAIIEDDTLVRLIAMPNVIVSSQQAFLTKEALNYIAAVTVDNLLKFGRGEPSPDTEVCAPKEQDQRRS